MKTGRRHGQEFFFPQKIRELLRPSRKNLETSLYCFKIIPILNLGMTKSIAFSGSLCHDLPSNQVESNLTVKPWSLHTRSLYNLHSLTISERAFSSSFLFRAYEVPSLGTRRRALHVIYKLHLCHSTVHCTVWMPAHSTFNYQVCIQMLRNAPDVTAALLVAAAEWSND